MQGLQLLQQALTTALAMLLLLMVTCTTRADKYDVLMLHGSIFRQSAQRKFIRNQAVSIDEFRGAKLLVHKTIKLKAGFLEIPSRPDSGPTLSVITERQCLERLSVTETT